MKTLKRNHCSQQNTAGINALFDGRAYAQQESRRTNGLKGENLAGSLKRVMCDRYHVGWYAFKIWWSECAVSSR